MSRGLGDVYKRQLQENDLILVITTPGKADALRLIFGEQETKDWNTENIDWNSVDSQLISQRILVTRPEINGKKLSQLRLRNTYGINISRVYRSGVQLLATPDLRLQLGDRLTVVGEAEAIRNVEKILGNAVKSLNEPNLAAVFIGLILGLTLGSIPVAIPGISIPVKLGLAGGPIIVGILIGTFGPRLHMITYTTQSANLMLRLRAWRPYQLQCVADAFSTKFETEQTPQTVQTESLACTLDETVTLTGSGPLPDAGAKILACFASFGPALLAYRENNWDLTSRVTVTAFGENSLSELESYEKVLELALPLGRELPSDAELIPECWLRAEDLRCVCANGTLEVNLSVKAEGAILQRSGNTCVGSIALGEPLTPADPEISLRIYYAQAGEELFAIARRFHVSPAQMLAANDLAEGTTAIDAPQRLLVPGAGG